jgi:hypothetical protein
MEPSEVQEWARGVLLIRLVITQVQISGLLISGRRGAFHLLIQVTLSETKIVTSKWQVQGRIVGCLCVNVCE